MQTIVQPVLLDKVAQEQLLKLRMDYFVTKTQRNKQWQFLGKHLELYLLKILLNYLYFIAICNDLHI